MKVLFVPVFEDNYSYLLVNSLTNEAVAVDPAEPAKVLAEANKHGVSIKSILTTHHHWYEIDVYSEVIHIYHLISGITQMEMWS